MSDWHILSHKPATLSIENWFAHIADKLLKRVLVSACHE